MNCANCKHAMVSGLASWHFLCSKCGLEASTLEPAELSASDAAVDEVEREAGLEHLRKSSFEETYQILLRFAQGGRLLDVGCAHGWFLDTGRNKGFECLGIEPSTRVAARGMSRGHRVLAGYFPAVLDGEDNFDVISFNDVFEHIPDARKTMQDAGASLREGGVLSIAIPSSRGIFYRLSKILARVGINGPFERMWQKQFSSPHLYYFNEAALTQLARESGFQRVYFDHLPSVRINGLWERLSYDTTSSRAKNTVIFMTVFLLSPFLKILPADIDLVIYKKTKTNSSV